MSTATIVRPSAAPTVRALLEDEARCVSDHKGTEARLHELQRQSRSDDSLARRQAQRLLPDAEEEVETAADRVEAARRATQQEVDRLRGDLVPRIRAEWCAALRALDEALAPARDANERLVRVVEKAQDVLGADAGRAVDASLCWGELADETPTCASKLATWRTQVRKAGIDIRG